MNLKDIIAIDVHTHYNSGTRFDSDTSIIYRADLEFLKEASDAANVGPMFCSTFSSVLHCEDVVSENEIQYEDSQKYEYIYQWVVIEPRIEETFLQADRMLKSKKCAGIKLHSPCHRYSISEYADRIFKFAADRGAVVLMHPDEMMAMPKFTDKYPDMKLIIAHLGTVEHVEAMAASKAGNIYTDTSGSASINNNMLEYCIERVGSERILFGTDTYAASFQRGRIEYARINDKDKIKILRENAIRIFPQLSL